MFISCVSELGTSGFQHEPLLNLQNVLKQLLACYVSDTYLPVFEGMWMAKEPEQ